MRKFSPALHLMIIALSMFSTQVFSQIDSTLFKQGYESFRKADYMSSSQVLSEFIDKYPEVPDGYYQRGIVLFRMGDQHQACSDLVRARELKYKAPFVPYICEYKRTLEFLSDYYYHDIKLDSSLDYRPHYTMKDTLRGALRPERNCFDVTFYDLSVRIIPRNKSVKGHNHIFFNVLEPTTRIQLDLFENMIIDSIRWNGQTLTYTRRYDAVFIDFPSELNKGSVQKVSFYYHGVPRIAVRAPWDGGFDWDRENLRRRWVGVACQHLGASCWWPNKDHLSDEPDSMRINLEVPARYEGISNGVMTGTKRVGLHYRRYSWFVHYPINNYNVTFYMGRYKKIVDSLMTDQGKLKIEYFVLPEHYKLAQTYFKQTLRVLEDFNEFFGTYPFIKDKFSLVESSYSGMEHQSAIAYGNSFGSKESRTYEKCDDDYIIVHEAAHEWWGNSVSCGDFADAWIHEGFATYAELMYLEKKMGYEKGYIPQLRKYREQIFNFWPMVEHRDVNEYAFASGDIYMKGATVIDNLRCTINNDSLFFKILHDFPVDFKYSIVTSQDFITYVNTKTGDNYDAFFKKFLYDRFPPVLTYDYKIDGKDIILVFKWDGVDTGFKMPFCIRYDGNRAKRIMATSEAQAVRLDNTSTFNFYTPFAAFKGCEKNGYTYYWTKKSEGLK